MLAIATLSIFRMPGGYLFHFQAPGLHRPAAVLVATQSFSSQQDQELAKQITNAVQLLNQLLLQRSQPATQSVREEQNQTTSDHLLSLGRLLYNQLLPAAIQQALALLPAPSPLIITTTAPELPWELLHDGDNYLALKHQVARQLPVATAIRTPPVRQRSTTTALLIGNPTQDLPQASYELRELADLIVTTPKMVGPIVLLRTSATKAKVLQEVASGARDLIHYSGHVLFHPAAPQASGLLLADREVLTAADIKQNLGGHPLVFLNGCESGRSNDPATAVDNHTYWEDALQGLAAAFIQGGAAGFIGTFWPVYDSRSKEFALAFYRQILHGATIGTALYKTRTTFANATDPLWASYVFYGDPRLALTTSHEPKPQPATALAVRFLLPERDRTVGKVDQVSKRITPYVTQIADQINHHGGHIYSIGGDTLLALFGFPQTQENDADRAIYAALAIQELVVNLSADSPPAAIDCAIGLSSGDVLLQEINTSTQTTSMLTGISVEQALRLTQQPVEAGIVMASSTAELTRLHLALGEPRSLTVNGSDQVWSVYPVHGVQIATTQSWQPPQRPITIIERANEVAVLLETWQRCRHGSGQIVNIVGEAGIGKSRLLQEFHQHLRGEELRWLYAASPALYRSAPYHLLGQLFQTLFEITPGDTAVTIQCKISATLQHILGTQLGPQDLAENLALLGEILSLPLATVAPEHLEAPARRRRLTNLLGRLLVRSAAQLPLIVVLEDLHWADEASLQTLEQIVNGIDKAPILVITLFRPQVGWQPSWVNRPNCRTLALHNLSEMGSRELMAKLLTTAVIADNVTQVVHLRSNGNPFFIREWVIALVEANLLQYQQGQWQATSPLETVETPGSIQRVLFARVAALPSTAQRLLSLAAVIGDRFTHRVLQTVLTESGENVDLEEGLVQLEKRGLIQQPLGEDGYQFTHALIQEVVYDSLLPLERQRYHHRIGRVLEITSGGREPEMLELLAYHYLRSDNRGRAVFYGVQAARRAASVWANQTALHLCEALLEKLQSFGATPLTEFEQLSGVTVDQLEGWQIELLEIQADVLAAVGHNDSAITSYQAALQRLATDNRFSNSRQAALLRKIAMTQHNKGALADAQTTIEMGLACLHGEVCVEAGQLHISSGLLDYRRGNLEQALLACERGIVVIERTNSRQDLAQAYNLQGIIYRNLGDSGKAVLAHEKSIALYRQINHLSGLERAISNLACAYQDLGRWGEALPCFQESVRISEKIGDERRRAAAAINLGEIYSCQGNLREAIAVNEQARQIGETYQFAEVLGITAMNLGFSHSKLGEYIAAQSTLHNSYEIFVRIGAEIHLPEVLRYQAIVHLGLHEPQIGLELAQQALDWATKLKRKLQSGQAYRVIGQAFHALGDYAKADDHLRESLVILKVQNSPYEIGLTLLEFARLSATQASIDPQQALFRSAALTYCTEALAIFDRLGAAFDLQRAQTLHQQLTPP